MAVRRCWGWRGNLALCGGFRGQEVIPCGNGLHKPLDSGFRRNDGEGNRHDSLIFKVIPATVILVSFGPLPPFFIQDLKSAVFL